ncbi:unnamed protein product [Lota lota]
MRPGRNLIMLSTGCMAQANIQHIIPTLIQAASQVLYQLQDPPSHLQVPPGPVPQYLTELRSTYTPSRHLRSSDTGLLPVPRTRL